MYSPMRSLRLAGSAKKRPHPATVDMPIIEWRLNCHCRATLEHGIWSGVACRSAAASSDNKWRLATPATA